MGKITFVAHDNTEHVAEFEAGVSLMQIAVDNAIPGIDGDCGGECACGTCHVIVAADWFKKTGTPSDDEEHRNPMQLMFSRPRSSTPRPEWCRCTCRSAR